ncbi:Mitochondrial nicotinamide adenine dinucleotide transporter 1 [Tolypocladium paradoxum]|uniref:Mitochondrial nicotinamide adenine dinucleotide transporter 1 n=1 Tax=Tolypocladium paradoxum TaxID=94208 RepID=A0A2S4LA23_9HYPO|nr:Mitochondrial nicotinamide adenine dinucleotide transporter 1 [Tolypocladium paradoxum]
MSLDESPEPSRVPSSPDDAAASYPRLAADSTPMHQPGALTPLQKWAVRASDSQFNAIAGAIGGFTSGIVTCPLDVIKTKLQAQGAYKLVDSGRHVGHPKMYNGLMGTARVIWRQEGIRGMYRGLGPIVLGYLPTWAVWFTVYNKSKVWMAQYSANTHIINFWSSIIAGASSTIATNPIWVIKTRLMSQSHSPAQDHHFHTMFPKPGNTPTARPTLQAPWHYRSTIDAARKMYTSEGLVSFYSGLTPALLGLTHVAVQFPTYEFLKTTFTGQGMGEAPAHGEKAHWMGILSASILSKILASSATYPHEVIRTRLQTQRRPVAGEQYLQGLGIAGSAPNGASGKDPRKYRGIVMTFQTILREEGWRAFYAGLGTNMMRAVPAATVTMLTYEYVMRQLNGAKADGKAALEGRSEGV